MDEQGTSVGEFDKGKIVNNLVSISLYLFCIFLFIFMVLCFFGVLGLIWKNIEEKSLNRSKRNKIGKNLWSWWILDRSVDLVSQSFQEEAQHRIAGFWETENYFLFQLSREGET